MAFLTSLDIAGSALTAQRLRMDVISQNLTNYNTTRTENGGPYVRKQVVFQERQTGAFARELVNATQKQQQQRTTHLGGVRVTAILEDTDTPTRPVYNPSHPDADENGYVQMPNVNTTQEMVDLMESSRSFENSLNLVEVVKGMAMKALEIGK